MHIIGKCREMNELLNGINTSLIDSTLVSNENYQVDLITNKNIKTITYLERNLHDCSEFLISVAFITKSGVALLKPLLIYLNERNISGKIVSGDYLGFTEPNALRELNKFENIEVKLNFSNNLHAKGYFFKQDDRWNVIVGSSNLTQTALTSNSEWNLKVSTSLNGKLCDDIIREFYNIFHQSKNLLDVIDDYEEYYLKRRQTIMPRFENKELKPNDMQLEALESLSKCRSMNNDRALIISATGTGKTLLAAFDVNNVNPHRMLFIVHRENIANAAMQSFKRVMPDKTMGLYTGNNKFPDAEYIFATIQTLTKDNHLRTFAKDYFNYIIFDEVHHLGAPSYIKVYDYFTPKFTLGLTATPERNDDVNIFELFNYNIAYEIRLHDALEAEYLVPFHYYGISDFVDADSTKPTFETLTAEDRVNQIIEKSKYYGHSGDKLHGLIFASSVKEVNYLEKEFNRRGIAAKGLTGNNNEDERNDAIQLLEEGIYDFLITVDIFNEGIDIKCVNQVIFLRQTESSIIFIQQLGRGLRLDQNKDYLVVLDFIGNYKTDFLIPTALSQNNNYEKEDMLRFVASPNEFVPGATTVHFEEIAKQKLFKNIRSMNLSNQTTIIKHDYLELQKRLGRRPLLNDFYEQRLISPNLILKKYDTILDLYAKIHDEDIPTNIEYNHIRFISKYLTPARRPHEFIILRELLNGDKSFEQLCSAISDYTNNIIDETENTQNALKHLLVTTYDATYKEQLPIIENISGKYYRALFNISNKFICDLIDYNLAYYNDNYSVGYPLSNYAIYDKSDISKILLFDNYQGGNNVQGYKFNHETQTCVAFITLSNESNYDTHDDRILSRRFVQWHSQNNKYISKNNKLTNEGQIITGLYDLYVFIQKNKKEPFYSFGKIKNATGKEITTNANGKDINKVEFNLELEKEIPLELYNYLIM